MTIHKEGYVSIFITLALVLLLSSVAHYYMPQSLIALTYAIDVLLFLFWLFIISFFRYPLFEVPYNDLGVLAPAYGKVVVIEEIEEKEYFNDKRIQVSIFMSPLNIHANWYPISGLVTYFKYHAGKHLVASLPKSSELNERTTVVVQHKNQQEVLFRQVAGAVARRIVCYSKKGQEATQGGNYGFIKFGSRVDIILPLGTEINVKIGDKVKAKRTTLATLKEA